MSTPIHQGWSTCFHGQSIHSHTCIHVSTHLFNLFRVEGWVFRSFVQSICLRIFPGVVCCIGE